MIRKAVASVVVVACSLALVGFSQNRIDTLREDTLDDQLLYIPSRTVLKHLTAGMSNVVADLLWLETIQYAVREFHDPQRKFKWLNHMLLATVELDPYFEGAYVNGGTFLSAIGEDERALDLLKKGFVENPDSWKLPHEIVKVYVLNRRDDPEAPTVATHYLRMVAERHHYPQLYLNWARQIQERDTLAGQSRGIWEDVIANAKDPFVREVAQQNLMILVAHDSKDALQELVDRYRNTYGSAPQELDALVQIGWIAALPDPAVYGEFYLNSGGEVESQLVLEDRKERILMSLNARLRVLRDEQLRFPQDIREAQEWLDTTLPEYPLPVGDWTYDASTGELS